jgi:hypothetical protein
VQQTWHHHEVACLRKAVRKPAELVSNVLSRGLRETIQSVVEQLHAKDVREIDDGIIGGLALIRIGKVNALCTQSSTIRTWFLLPASIHTPSNVHHLSGGVAIVHDTVGIALATMNLAEHASSMLVRQANSSMCRDERHTSQHGGNEEGEFVLHCKYVLE